MHKVLDSVNDVLIVEELSILSLRLSLCNHRVCKMKKSFLTIFVSPYELLCLIVTQYDEIICISENI